MQRNLVQPKVGLLLFSNAGLKQSGEGTPGGTYEKRMEKAAVKIRKRLKFAFQLVYETPVYTGQELRHAMEAFYMEHVDGVLAIYLSWAPDAGWIRFLRDMPPVPVLFASLTPEKIPFQNTFSVEDSVAANTVRGLVGSLQASGSMVRYRRPMLESCLGSYEEVVARAKSFFTAARVRSRLQNALFAHLARSHEVMWSTYVDAFSLFQHIGPEVKIVANATIRNEMERIGDADVTRAVEYLKSHYTVLPEVKDEDKFRASMQASIACDRVAASLGAEMIVMNDLDTVMHRELGLRPGFLPVPFGGDIPATPEGDIGAATAAYILRQLSCNASVVVEPGYINARDGTFDVGHGGPNDYTDPQSNVVIATDTRLLNAKVRYPGAPFAWQVISPGPKTMLHLSQTQEGFKMACTLVESLPVERFHTNFCHSRCRTLTGDAQAVFGKLMKFGTTQHFAMTHGDFRSEVRDLAAMLGVEYLEA